MEDNSVAVIQFHSWTLVASFFSNVLRLSLEINHQDQVIYMSPKYSKQYFPQQLQILFEDIKGFYQYIYKIALKQQSDRLSFKNGLLIIKVAIDDKFRQIPIMMKCMRQYKSNFDTESNNNFMLTSIAPQQHRVSRMSSIGRSGVNLKLMSSKLQTESKTLQGIPGARLKLMMMKQNNKMKKAISRIPEYSTSTATQPIRQYPYIKPQTISRYQKFKTDESNNKHSFSQQKVKPQKRGHSYQVKRGIFSRIKTNKDNIDLSNKQIRWQQIRDFINLDWLGVNVLNLGYNNIGNQGLKLLTSISWPSLKTLYVCFNNINKIEWTVANICFVRTLSLSIRGYTKVGTRQNKFLKVLCNYNFYINYFYVSLKL